MRTESEDDWDDDSYGDDDASDSGEHEDLEPTVPCPYCGFEMLEVCVQCPSCGQYPSNEDSNRNPKPRWIILTAIVCLAAILFGFVMFYH